MGVLVRELVAKLVSLIPLRLNFATTFGRIPRKRSTCLLLRCAMRKWICAFVWRQQIGWSSVVTTTARLVRSGGRSEGGSLSAADQSRPNLVSGGPEDPNHDAAMRIGSEAPKRRTHSFPRHNSHGTNRDPPPRTVIGDRHKRTDWAETVGSSQQPPFIAPGAERRRPAPRPLARAATRRSKACAPRPRS